MTVWPVVMLITAGLWLGAEMYALFSDDERWPTFTRFVQRHTRSWTWLAVALYVVGTGAVAYHLFVD